MNGNKCVDVRNKGFGYGFWTVSHEPECDYDELEDFARVYIHSPWPNFYISNHCRALFVHRYENSRKVFSVIGQIKLLGIWLFYSFSIISWV
ncbi:hypothetical protein [Daejeonella lutea]|uniref:Uncharacterized protein n=1 Tax=Daejeonella lutea TaxID=572036 RepID=A0A1T5A9D4_9SPHI|nr:hypothetical protein [Daejeonella lutea]SKB31337.1 hypothetical protein SAMN05661099_0451 [Daejeonella lutea]